MQRMSVRARGVQGRSWTRPERMMFAMSKKHLLRLGVTLGSVLMAACSADPEQGKRKYLESGLRYMEQRKYQESITQFKHALRLDPHYIDALYQLSEAYLADQQWAEAFAVSQRAAA